MKQQDESGIFSAKKSSMLMRKLLARDPEEVSAVARTKSPASIHVLSVMYIGIMSFFFKKEKLREVYLRVLENKSREWEILYPEKPYNFQRDESFGPELAFR